MKLLFTEIEWLAVGWGYGAEMWKISIWFGHVKFKMSIRQSSGHVK